jgi:hypothetical protein
MKEQIKEYKSELNALVENIKNTTGANEVRINVQSTPRAIETRINLEFIGVKELPIEKNCYGI